MKNKLEKIILGVFLLFISVLTGLNKMEQFKQEQELADLKEEVRELQDWKFSFRMELNEIRQKINPENQSRVIIQKIKVLNVA